MTTKFEGAAAASQQSKRLLEKRKKQKEAEHFMEDSAVKDTLVRLVINH